MSSPHRSRALIVGGRVLLLASLCAVAWIALNDGLRLRRWAWDQTDPIHFYPDMNNGIHWGSQGNEPPDRPRGLLNVYDLVAGSAKKGNIDSPDYGLDYAPLRLLIITRWEAWAQQANPKLIATAMESGARRRNAPWHPPYDLYAPLLRFNTATELAAAVGLFLLTRHWVVRGDRRWGSSCRAGTFGAIVRPFRGCGAGAAAVLLFWFNPAVLLSAHGWPTWDEWIIPFFVWTLWLCCIDWWSTAGAVLALGAMFKGQQLFVAPMFVLWPLLMGRPMSALRWVAGLALGIAVLASPWLLTYVPGGVTAQTIPSDRRVDHWAVCFIIAILLLIAIPAAWNRWMRFRNSQRGSLDSDLTSRPPRALIKTLRWLRPLYGPLAALTLAVALLLCADLFHGSLNWLYIGWGYGTRHYLNMVTGLSDNLAGLLNERYGWNNLADIVYTVAAHPFRIWPGHTLLLAQPTPITIRALLVSLYLLLFTLCVVGMAIQYRRNDPRFLVAATAVWLMFFTFMPQIHERYLLYAAGVGCSLAAVNLAFVLLDLFLTTLTFVMTIHVMLVVAAGDGQLRNFATDVSPTFGRSLFRVVSKTYPDAGWALLLCCAIFLFHAIAPSPGRKPQI